MKRRCARRVADELVGVAQDGGQSRYRNAAPEGPRSGATPRDTGWYSVGTWCCWGADRSSQHWIDCSALRAGRSAALVVRGEPGVGKTALLEYAVERAARCRVVRASGLESEIELTFGALHQLCAGLLARRNALPEPQADALAIAFGLKVGTPPDRLFVGLAGLGLVSKDGARRMAAAPSKVTGCARLAGQLVPARLVRRASFFPMVVRTVASSVTSMSLS